MSKHIWHSGPPPSVGWWPASRVEDPQSIRWWNGKRWSIPASPSETFGPFAASKAAIESPFTNNVEWCARWWE